MFRGLLTVILSLAIATPTAVIPAFGNEYKKVKRLKRYDPYAYQRAQIAAQRRRQIAIHNARVKRARQIKAAQLRRAKKAEAARRRMHNAWRAKQRRQAVKRARAAARLERAWEQRQYRKRRTYIKKKPVKATVKRRVKPKKVKKLATKKAPIVRAVPVTPVHKPVQVKKKAPVAKAKQPVKKSKPQVAPVKPVSPGKPVKTEKLLPKQGTSTPPAKPAKESKSTKPKNLEKTAPKKSEKVAPKKIEKKEKPPKINKSSKRQQLKNLVTSYAKAHNLPTKLADAVATIESNYRPWVTGPKGSVGMMQIKYTTARELGYRGSRKGLYDPETNVKFAMRYLAGAFRRAKGDICKTVWQYNAGYYAKRMNPISAKYCRRTIAMMGTKHVPYPYNNRPTTKVASFKSHTKSKSLEPKSVQVAALTPKKQEKIKAVHPPAAKPNALDAMSKTKSVAKRVAPLVNQRQTSPATPPVHIVRVKVHDLTDIEPDQTVKPKEPAKTVAVAEKGYASPIQVATLHEFNQSSLEVGQPLRPSDWLSVNAATIAGRKDEELPDGDEPYQAACAPQLHANKEETTQSGADKEEEIDKAPKSFWARLGNLGAALSDLIMPSSKS